MEGDQPIYDDYKLNEAMEFAKKANSYVMNDELLQAVKLYTKSIELCPNEHRFCINRTLCYIKMDYIFLALNDINRAIELEPTNSKCFFIRSKIFKILNEYEMAEKDLQKAANLDPTCEEIIDEINHLKKSGQDNYLLKDRLSGYNLNDKTYYKIKVNFHLIHAPNLPTNLWNYHGIRIENLNPKISIETICSNFNLFGDIIDVKRVGRLTAYNTFIFYENPVTPMFTIAYFQNRIDEELCAKEWKTFKPMKIYFAPTDNQNELKFFRPKYPIQNSQECYYWRTTSCNLNNHCSKWHIVANKNIDTQIWMKEKTCGQFNNKK